MRADKYGGWTATITPILGLDGPALLIVQSEQQDSMADHLYDHADLARKALTDLEQRAYDSTFGSQA